MKYHEGLLELAESLAIEGARSRAMKRRAVSTAYYAAFHALVRLCADELAGIARRRTPEYERLYRALDHSQLRTAFISAPLKGHSTLSPLGDIVVKLQTERNRADYLPPQSLFSASQCVDLIQLARDFVGLLERLDNSERRTLSIYLLFKNRAP